MLTHRFADTSRGSRWRAFQTVNGKNQQPTTALSPSGMRCVNTTTRTKTHLDHPPLNHRRPLLPPHLSGRGPPGRRPHGRRRLSCTPRPHHATRCDPQNPRPPTTRRHRELHPAPLHAAPWSLLLLCRCNRTGIRASGEKATPSGGLRGFLICSRIGTCSQSQKARRSPNSDTRYDVVDHIFSQRLSPARVMETRNRRKVEAFIARETYVRQPGDPHESE